MKLLMCITLLALLQWIKAQENSTEVGFPASEAQKLTYSNGENRANGSGESGTKPENQSKSQLFPPIRCLSCDNYCDSYEGGRDKNGKGNRLCQIEMGVIHGCVSIYKFGLKRMCVVEMSMEDNIYCNDNPKLCVKCTEPDCNYINLTANGVQVKGSGTIRTPLLWLLGTCFIARLGSE